MLAAVLSILCRSRCQLLCFTAQPKSHTLCACGCRGQGDSSMAREAAMLGGGTASLGGGAATRPYSFY